MGSAEHFVLLVCSLAEAFNLLFTEMLLLTKSSIFYTTELMSLAFRQIVFLVFLNQEQRG